MNFIIPSDEYLENSDGFLFIQLNHITKTLNELKEKFERTLDTENVAILWDVENVTPSVDSLFVEGFLEYAEQFGRITVAKAFADWTKLAFSKLAEPLSRNRFELIYTPASRKNSSDISLITHGMELALKNPKLQTFILVTGDSDFRPLILSLVRSGKRIHIVCNVQNASEDLLVLADSFKDYRELIPGGQEKEIQHLEGKETDQKDFDIEGQKEIAFIKLVEAIESLKKDKKNSEIGFVKVKIKMLNPSFNEKNLGYKKWSDFVEDAVSLKIVEVETKGSVKLLRTHRKDSKTSKVKQPKAFTVLIQALKQLDKEKKPEFRKFAIVANELYNQIPFLEIKKLGFKKFKDFILAAETRNLVETKVKGTIHYVRRVI